MKKGDIVSAKVKKFGLEFEKLYRVFDRGKSKIHPTIFVFDKTGLPVEYSTKYFHLIKEAEVDLCEFSVLPFVEYLLEKEMITNEVYESFISVERNLGEIMGYIKENHFHFLNIDFSDTANEPTEDIFFTIYQAINKNLICPVQAG